MRATELSKRKDNPLIADGATTKGTVLDRVMVCRKHKTYIHYVCTVLATVKYNQTLIDHQQFCLSLSQIAFPIYAIC